MAAFPKIPKKIFKKLATLCVPFAKMKKILIPKRARTIIIITHIFQVHVDGEKKDEDVEADVDADADVKVLDKLRI
jgi:hypothetical protein